MARIPAKKTSSAPSKPVLIVIAVVVVAGIAGYFFTKTSAGKPFEEQTARENAPVEPVPAPTVTPTPATAPAPKPVEPVLATPPAPPALPANLPAPETVTLKCTADNSIIAYSKECVFNHGDKADIRIKGIDHLAAMKFDVTPVKGMVIEKAVLRFKQVAGEFIWMDASTIATDWVEGKSSKYEVDEAGNGSCFLFASWSPDPKNAKPWGRFPIDAFTPEMMRNPDQACSVPLPQDDFTDVSFYSGRCIFKDYIRVNKIDDTMREIEIPGRIVEANAQGIAYGIALHDGNGQTAQNNAIASRETRTPPELIVTGRRYDTTPPAAPSVSAEAVAPGRVKFTVINPGDDSGTLAYILKTVRNGSEATVARNRINANPGEYGTKTVFTLYDEPVGPVTYKLAVMDRAGNVGDDGKAQVSVTPQVAFDLFDDAPKVTVTPSASPAKAGDFTIWAVPDTSQVDPVSGSSFARGDERLGNVVWDAASKTVRLKSARNEVIAFQLIVEAANGASGLSVDKAAITGPSTIPADNIDLFRTWYVKCKDDKYHPEPCVPLSGAFDIPWKENNVPDQKNQSVWVDIAVPKDAAPGEYKSQLTLKSGGASTPINVELEVWTLTLPDFPTYTLELNAYSGVGSGLGINRDTPEYANLELAFHQLGHSHRQTVNVLPYGQRGNISANAYIPEIAGTGADVKVSSWQNWDARFGKYFDGSAFTPQSSYKGLWQNTPVTHFYLPLHENWPLTISEYYSVKVETTEYPALVIEHAQKAPPIEEAFPEVYKQAFKSMAGQYVGHIRDKKWDKTRFQLYLNNKYYFKEPGKDGRPGRGSSWWLLDEPRNTNDFLALKFYGELFWQGAGADARKYCDYRIDLSRPQWQHDTLDGIGTLIDVSAPFYQKHFVVEERKDRFNETYWHYGGASSVGSDNLALRALLYKDWTMGADGSLPYYTSFSAGNGWDSPDELALVLEGKKVGIIGPIASVRLKVLRRGQQDIEYLNLASAKYGRERVEGSLAKAVNLTAKVESRNADDPGRATFSGLNENVFESLRRHLAFLAR